MSRLVLAHRTHGVCFTYNDVVIVLWRYSDEFSVIVLSKCLIAGIHVPCSSYTLASAANNILVIDVRDYAYTTSYPFTCEIQMAVMGGLRRRSYGESQTKGHSIRLASSKSWIAVDIEHRFIHDVERMIDEIFY
jgi:hypothetical protein